MQTLEKLYKVDSQGRLREWTMHIDGNSFYAVKGLVGMKLTQDKPTTSTAKNIGRSNETTDAEQAVGKQLRNGKRNLKKVTQKLRKMQRKAGFLILCLHNLMMIESKKFLSFLNQANLAFILNLN